MSFASHVALIEQVLARRRAVAERLEATLLNARSRERADGRPRAYFEQAIDACVFGLPDIPRELAALKGQLAAQHVADGFEPVSLEGFAQDVDPAELIVRAWRHWDRHRWPGSSGRLAYADVVVSVIVLRQLQYLSLRIWDADPEVDGGAEQRFQTVQALLDRANASSALPFVRDAAWLIQTAQGPLTRHLAPYFDIADRVAQSLPDGVRLAAHAAGAKLAGGHLRSQQRYRAASLGRATDDPEVLAVTRNSNAMDGALLLRDLTALLDAYAAARTSGSPATRLDLADAILQGLSADPELFVLRLDLLGPCVLIEELFVTRDDQGRATWTPRGADQVTMLERYSRRLAESAPALLDDIRACDPAGRAYSPLGIIYGFCADLFSNMAAGALAGQPSRGVSFEDLFSSAGALDDKRARAMDWQQLPRREGESEHFSHDAAAAVVVFDRTLRALEARAATPEAANASGVADAVIRVNTRAETDPPGSADEYCFTTDLTRAFAGAHVAWPKSRMLEDRREGRYLASAETDGKWFGVSKAVLTLFLSQGRDAVLTNVPAAVVDVLRLAGFCATMRP